MTPLHNKENITSFVPEKTYKELLLKYVNFYEREIVFSKTISESRLDLKWYQTVNEYINAYQEIVTSIKNLLISQDLNLKDFNEIRLALEFLPAPLHFLLVSFLQRKEHPIKYFPHKTVTTYSFSEVHPDYSSSIHALEKISEYWFQVLSPIYTPFSIKNPILTISNVKEIAFGLTFRTEPTKWSEKIKRFIPFLLSNEWYKSESKDISRIGKNLTISRFLLPRYTPTLVSVTSLGLAHEYFHLVGILTDICWLDRKINNKNFEDMIPSYGDKIVALSLRRFNLEKKLASFGRKIINEECTLREEVTGLFNVFEDFYFPEHIVEFISDIGAILIAGPAYAYFYLLESLGSLSKKECYVYQFSRLTHPPDPCRLFLQSKVLKLCGLEKDATLINDYLEIYYKDSWDDYNKWIDSCWDDFVLIVETLHSLSNYQCMFYKNPNFTQNFDSKCEEIIKNIEAISPTAKKYTPVEILNAFWYKMIFENRDLNEMSLFDATCRIFLTQFEIPNKKEA